jgi:dTDP-4-amino-4,6-dideoxygalactose transaminase
MVDRFEAAFAQYVGARAAVAVSSGTAALHLALRIMGVGPGDAVIVPTLTFIGGVAPITYLGATPIFVDCETETWGLNPALVADAASMAERRGLKARCVVPADLYGQRCMIADIAEASRQLDVPLVLDSAEAVGATFQGRHTGFGEVASVYSFNGNKLITTSGGGMLVSDDVSLIGRARYLAQAARQPQPYYEHTEIGYNYRLSNLLAGLGIAQLESVEQKVLRRRRIFEMYKAALGDLPGVSFTSEANERRHTRWLTVMLLDRERQPIRPEELRLALEAEAIEARPTWKPMHLQPVFADALTVGGECAAGFFEDGICLPSGSGLSDADVDRVCATIRSALHP